MFKCQIYARFITFDFRCVTEKHLFRKFVLPNGPVSFSERKVCQVVFKIYSTLKAITNLYHE